MIHFEAGVKLSDPDFVQIKEILKRAQAGIDEERAVLEVRIRDEDPNFRNDEPRRRLVHNTVRIKKEALAKVAKLAADIVANSHDPA